MNKQNAWWVFLIVALVIAASCRVAEAAGLDATISLDTSLLAGSAAGPFELAFVLTDGSGTVAPDGSLVDDANNTVTLRNFSFGAGSAGATDSALTGGGVSGDLASAVSLVDSDFLNVFALSFTPGNTLSFLLSLTTNVDAGFTPDQLSFLLFQGDGSPVNSHDPSGSSALLTINIDASRPPIVTFAGDLTPAPALSVAVPEPPILILLATAMLGVLRTARWRSDRAAAASIAPKPRRSSAAASAVIRRSVVAAAAISAVAIPGASIATTNLLFRTYLSVAGSDAHPCTAQQPCRLLPAALAAVADGGEIWILDSANYNTAPVNVTKSVTILAIPGAVGSVVATGGGDAIKIDAAGRKVTLRNVVIVPLGSSTNGIEFVNGANLIVDRCTLSGALFNGILISVPTDAGVLIKDTQISGASTGVGLGGSGGELIRVTLTDSVLSDVNFGLDVEATSEIAIDNSRIIGRGRSIGTGVFAFAEAVNAPIEVHIANSLIRGFAAGVLADQAAPFVSISVSGSELSHNQTAAQADGGSTIALSGNRLVHNGTSVAGATVFTSGTNYFAYNGSDGAALTGPGGLK